MSIEKESLENVKDFQDMPFISLFTLTEMLEKMGFEKLIDKLEDDLQSYDDKYREELNKILEIKDEKIKKDKLLKFNKAKQTIALKEVLKFIVLRPHKAKKEILQLVAEYEQINVDEAEKRTFKQNMYSLKQLMTNGVWDTIQDLIGKDRLNNLKKTL